MPNAGANPVQEAVAKPHDGHPASPLGDEYRGATFHHDLLIEVPPDGPNAHLRLDGLTVNGSLTLTGGHAGPKPFGQAHAQIIARNMRVNGDLLIENLTADGLLLNNSHVTGDLRITACRITSPTVDQPSGTPRDAIRARDIIVDGSVLIRGKGEGRSFVLGRIYLAGARIGGTLEFSGIDLQGSSNAIGHCKALTLANAQIGGDLAWLTRAGRGGACRLIGDAKADSAHVGGRVRVSLAAPQLSAARLSLRACEIDAALQIYPPGGVDACALGRLDIDAGDAKADAIILHGFETPQWTLDVRGTTYNSLLGCLDTENSRPIATPEVLEFFRKQVVRPSAVAGNTFSPQPYQQFIRLCRAEGANDEADRAVRDWIRAMPKTDRFSRVTYAAFGMFARFGLEPQRITAIYLAAILICTAMIAGGQAAAPRVFVDPLQGTLQQMSASSSIAVSAEGSFACVDRINPLVYALDVMVPATAFGQEAQCPMRGSAEGWWGLDPVSWFATLAALFRVAGLLMLAMLLLSYSGINRRIWQ